MAIFTHDMRHIGFPQVDGGQRDPQEMGPHNRGHSENSGCTKLLPPAVLDSEVEERIGGGETTFWDKREVEQRFMIDPLDLPGNEPTWIFRNAAREVEPDCCRLAGVDFLGAIEVDLGVQICKNNKKKMREEEERATKRNVEGK